MEQTGGDSRKRFLLVAIAVACGALAIVLLYSYLTTERQKVEQQMAIAKKNAEAAAAAAAAAPVQNMIPVFVAAHPLEAGVQLTAADLSVQNIPAEFITPQAVNANSNIIGMITTVPLAPGEQVLQSKISPYEKPKILAELTPPGKRAVAITPENFQLIANFLKPGDYVDVFASIVPPEGSPLAEGKADRKAVTLPLFQNVQVLLVGTSAKRGPNDPVQGTSVTLALTPQEAALVEFVQEQGKVRLVMRSNQDVDQAVVQVADWDSLFEYLYPDQKGLIKKPTVEIYRGLKKETVPLAEGKRQ